MIHVTVVLFSRSKPLMHEMKAGVSHAQLMMLTNFSQRGASFCRRFFCRSFVTSTLGSVSQMCSCCCAFHGCTNFSALKNTLGINERLHLFPALLTSPFKVFQEPLAVRPDALEVVMLIFKHSLEILFLLIVLINF